MQISKKFTTAVILFSFFLFNNLYAQSQISIGANIGYSGLDMTEVNDAFKAAEEEIQNNYSNYSFSREDVGGGLYFDGNIQLTFNNSLVTGLSVNYISASTEFSGDVNGSEFSNNYDFSTIEILAILGYKVPLGGTMSLPLKGFIGYGLPSLEVKSTPPGGSENTFDGSGGYFAARAQAGIEFDLNAVVLNAFLGYRIANAGALDITDENDNDVELNNADGDEMEFDYSGLLIGAGISFKL